MELLRDKDFCLTSRIHSGIMALWCGVPSFVVCVDTRMEEICRSHNIPYISAYNVDGNTNIFDLIRDIDFKETEETHKEKFWQYIDFLNENGVETIYDGGKIPEKNYFLEKLKNAQPSALIVKL